MITRSYENFANSCTEKIEIFGGQVSSVLRTCTEVPAETSLWVTLAPMFAVAAAIYAAMSSVGEYIELKDKNFKELLKSDTMTGVSSAYVYNKTRLRVGQRWQWSAKFSGALVALAILTTYFSTESGVFDLTTLAAGALTVVALGGLYLFSWRAKRAAILDAGLFTPEASKDVLTEPEPNVQ